VILVPVGPVSAELLEDLSRETGIPPGSPRVDPHCAWNPARRQYNSNRLLAELKHQYPGRVMGVTELDLFLPVLTFVFGEAELAGRVAIFSTHRLREEFYGLPGRQDLVFERSLRELWHEMGHLLGLTHCRDADCVMSSSHSVEQVDTKGAAYCSVCLGKLPDTLDPGLRRLARHNRAPHW
jgi:archaemetzincin